MNGDLISRSALFEAFNVYRDKHGDDCPWHISAIETVIEAAPAVDATPVVHGRWILQGFEDCMTRCSVCNVRAPRNNHGEMILSTFCWECGAKMDGGEENAAD